MDANQAAVWSAIAAIFSAVAAGISAFIAWRAKHVQTSAADFETCLSVVKELAEAQRRVRDASSEHAKFEFIELLNLMEALALLVNDGRPASSTKKVIARFVEEALRWIAATPGMSELMSGAMTSTGTFSELRSFQNGHVAAIRRTSALHKV